MPIPDKTVCPSPKSLEQYPFSRCVACLIVLLCVCAAASPVAGQSYFFKSFNDPNATGPQPGVPPRTNAFGINDYAIVVGSYSCCSSGFHAFLRSANIDTIIDYRPSSCGFSHCGSEARGINNSGEVVGDSTDASGNTIGYTYTNGNYSALPISGATYVQPNAINNLGEIVGIYDDLSFVQHGFIYNGGFASVDCSNGGRLFLNGVNDSGDTVGYCFIPGQPITGFKSTAATGQSTPISFAGASTQPTGINNSGQVAGFYLDSSSHAHGFLFFAGQIQPINDVPGSVNTYVEGINNNAQIVGIWEDAAGAFHGFVGSTAQLVDPVDDLLSGSAVRAPSSPADAQVLATLGQVVQGVAADGVTEALIRIPSNNVGDQFTLTVLNDSSQVQSNLPNEDGALGKPGDTSFSQTQVTATAIATSTPPAAPAPVAFAVYRAPIDFARQVSNGLYKPGTCGGVPNNDDKAVCRTVTIQAQNLTAGTTITLPVVIVRPPVILIHGLWSNQHSWDNFSPLFSNIGTPTPDPTFSVPRFYIGLADYSGTPADITIVSSTPNYGLSVLADARANSLGFQFNALAVMDQIKEHIRRFKSGRDPASVPVAAIQVDIVGHSMGGDISRTIALQSDFLAPRTFGQGIIHKLITIGTPHLGSPLATQLLQSQNSCVANLFASVAGNPPFSSVQVTAQSLAGGTATLTLPGAVGDLSGDPGPSQALQNIAAPGQHPLPTALVVGTVNSSNLLPLASNGMALTIHNGCISSPMAGNLTPAGWPSIFSNKPSDAIVSQNSQLNGLSPDPGSVFNGIIHSPGIEALGFAGPSEVDSGPVPTYVITLLNTPVTNALFHLLNP